MVARAYYNEIDKFAAGWLRNLIGAGLIAPGDVDERSIVDVRPDDLVGYRQCHFFAGIGGWSHALRLAGWPDDRPCFTGSCPCQPLSVAGQQRGHADERHLWPAFYNLISERRPTVCFGEQVASKIGREWLAGVRADLEGAGYACGAADLCAAGVGAPHRRQRLYWVAVGNSHGSGQPRSWISDERREGDFVPPRPDGREQDGTDCALAMADAEHAERWPHDDVGGSGHPTEAQGRVEGATEPRERDGSFGGLVDAAGERWREGRAEPSLRGGRDAIAGADEPSAVADDSCPRLERWGQPFASGEEHAVNAVDNGSFWSDAEWIACADGKARRAKRGIRLLVDGPAGSLERMRAIEDGAWEEIVNYGHDHQGDPNEILRVLREAVQSQEGGQASRIGVLQQLHAPEVLLDFLLGLDAARDRAAISSRRSPESEEENTSELRGLRDRDGAARGASRQREPEGQRPDESPNPLLELSQLLARIAETHREAARDADASTNRVGRWRGYGNAIVPQVAAEFIAAFAESADGRA